ncbi:unnamed protein product [Phytomonas sp. EM1]|nr:unnamed protein product [Phytomonas sp. EM1]|eukprot:CCW63259.1 unnamed protein product [Phytomonas sp. isolate EM1]
MRKVRELFELNPDLELLLHPTSNELTGLAEAIRSLRIQHQNDTDNDEIAFQLAVALISHSRLSFVEEGLHIMETLISTQWQNRWSKVLTQQYESLSMATPPPLPKDEDSEAVAAVEGDRRGVENMPTSGIHNECETSAAECSSPGRLIGEDCICIDAQHAMLGEEKTKTLSSGPQNGNPKHETSGNMGNARGRSQSNDDLHIFHYYLSLGWIKLKDFKRANSCISQMLILEPNSRQGQALKTYIEVAQRQGAAMNTAVIVGVSTALTGIAVALSSFLRGRESS